MSSAQPHRYVPFTVAMADRTAAAAYNVSGRTFVSGLGQSRGGAPVVLFDPFGPVRSLKAQVAAGAGQQTGVMVHSENPGELPGSEYIVGKPVRSRYESSYSHQLSISYL